MKALVLGRVGELAIRDIALPEAVGPQDVKIAIDTVGVCGSVVHYYTQGRIGDVAIVTGAGTIGIMVALAALAGDCSKVPISDISAEKLAIAAQYDGIIPVNVTDHNL